MPYKGMQIVFNCVLYRWQLRTSCITMSSCRTASQCCTASQCYTASQCRTILQCRTISQCCTTFRSIIFQYYRTPTHRTLSYYFCTSFRVHTASTIYNPNGVLGATLSDISNWIMVAICSENSVNIRWEFSKIQWEFSEHFSIKPRPTFKFGNIHEYAQIHPECEVS